MALLGEWDEDATGAVLKQEFRRSGLGLGLGLGRTLTLTPTLTLTLTLSSAGCSPRWPSARAG